MRDLIRQQLLSCSYADLSHFDSETQTFRIPKYNKPKYVLGNMYLVQVSNVMINNNTSTVAANWNNSTSPAFQYLKIYVSKELGKMIYVDSIGFDPVTKQDINILWSGWLPTEELTMISQIVM